MLKFLLNPTWQLPIWKLLAIVVSVTLAILVSLVWDDRDFLIRSATTRPAHVQLNVRSFEDQSRSLLARANASAIILWQVDITKNIRETLIFETTNGRQDFGEHVKAPLFSALSEENEFALHLLNNDVFCGNLVTRSKIGQKLLAENIIYLCRAPIISKQNLLVGYISLGFKERPSDVLKDAAILELRNLTKSLPLQEIH